MKCRILAPVFQTGLIVQQLVGGRGRGWGYACKMLGVMYLNYGHYLLKKLDFGFSSDTFLAVDSEAQVAAS